MKSKLIDEIRTGIVIAAEYTQIPNSIAFGLHWIVNDPMDIAKQYTSFIFVGKIVDHVQFGPSGIILLRHGRLLRKVLTSGEGIMVPPQST